LPSKIIIIAGGGKYGDKAVNYALNNDYTVILIDSNPNCEAAKYANLTTLNIDNIISNLESTIPKQLYFLNQDIAVLNDLLEKVKPEYVIPVVPIHLMAKIVEDFLSKNSIKLFPDNESLFKFVKHDDLNLILDKNPNQGILYLSYAKIDETCPDMCACPLNYCPNLNREKPITITEYVKNFLEMTNLIRAKENKNNELLIVLNSYQLTSGLGGLKGEEVSIILEKLKNKIDALKKKKFNLTIATACNCHGVISFYKNKS